MGNEKLEKLLIYTSQIDEIFDIFNNKSLILSDNYKMLLVCYNLGCLESTINLELKECEGHPDYEKAFTRIRIIRDKLYAEAKRRDENAK